MRLFSTPQILLACAWCGLVWWTVAYPAQGQQSVRLLPVGDVPIGGDVPAESLPADAPEEETAAAEESEAPAAKVQEDAGKKQATDQAASPAEEKPASSEASKPQVFTVKTKALTIQAELDGYFVAEHMEELALQPEVWTKFKILQAVGHGTHVQRGDILLRFDGQDLEDELAEEAIKQRLGELDFLRAEEDFPRKKKLLELKFAEAERKYQQFQENYSVYQEVDRPLMLKTADYRHKYYAEDLASQREELEQLKKMYALDELTEETEAIVLRRQNFQVEAAELSLEIAAADREYALKFQVPRRDEDYRQQAEEARIRFEQAQTAKELGLTRLVYEMEKLRESRARSVERHAKLVSDKGLMVLRAPTDGVVYYGRCVDGKWSEVAAWEAKLKPQRSVSTKAVLMTIVKQRPLQVVARCGEKHVPDLTVGLSARIEPTANQRLTWEGQVSRIGSVPGKSNKFKIRFSLDNANLPAWLVAGMTCQASVTTYRNPEALQIPAELVQSDEEDEQVKYVLLLEASEPLRRPITLGRKQGKMVEVLQGLEAGDQIVKPAEQESD